MSASNGSQQTDGKHLELSEGQDMHDRKSIQSKTSNHQSYLESLGVDKHSQEQLRESYNESARLEESLSSHKDNVDAYHEALDYSKTHGSEYSRDMTQDVISAYSDKYHVSDQDAAKAVSGGGAQVQEIFQDLSSNKANSILEQVTHDKMAIESSNRPQELLRDSAHQISQNPSLESSPMQTFRQEHNMKESTAAHASIGSTKDDLAKSHEFASTTTANKIDSSKEKAQIRKHDRQENINKLEEDRMGQGKFAKGLGTVVNYATQGTSGADIGRALPDKTDYSHFNSHLMKSYQNTGRSFKRPAQETVSSENINLKKKD